LPSPPWYSSSCEQNRCKKNRTDSIESILLPTLCDGDYDLQRGINFPMLRLTPRSTKLVPPS
jgi:hypothetical protein